jgi:hypothetical protein
MVRIIKINSQIYFVRAKLLTCLFINHKVMVT